MPDKSDIELGKKLKKLRTAKELTQEGLARKAKVNVTTVARLERGENTISLQTAKKLSKILGVQVSDLINY